MSKHYSSITPKEIVEKIDKGCKLLSSLYLNNWNPYQFVQNSVNCQRHPEAILETLRMVYRHRDTIKDVWAYAVSVCQIESKNFYKRDADREHQIEKNEWVQLVNALREVHGRRRKVD